MSKCAGPIPAYLRASGSLRTDDDKPKQKANTMNSISKIQASIAALHGDERSQRSKYDSFIAWQIRQRMQARGQEVPAILKQSVDDPCDEPNAPISTEVR